jgi:hypothetical protein
MRVQQLLHKLKLNSLQKNSVHSSLSSLLIKLQQTKITTANNNNNTTPPQTQTKTHTHTHTLSLSLSLSLLSPNLLHMYTI